MKMISFNTTITSFLLFAGCSGMSEEMSQGVTLSGSIEFPQQGHILLERYIGNGIEPFDTIRLKEDNTFNQFIEVEFPGYYRLNIYNIQQINLVLNKDDIQITVAGNNVGGPVDVQGSTELDQLKAFNQYLQEEFVSKENALNQEYTKAARAKNTQLVREIQDEYSSLRETKELAILDQIRSMGMSLATIQAINYIDKEKHFEFFDKWASDMTSVYPAEPTLIQLVSEADRLRKLAIGQEAPEISLPNPEGEVTSLSSLRGNYVLIDFWAEWCKPCRLENPNIVRAYKKYNALGFEVFGVSLDKQQSRWQKAINEDQLDWTQVSDLQGWQSSAAKLYNVSAIPASFLVDKEGIIIAKNLRGAALDQKLSELLGQ